MNISQFFEHWAIAENPFRGEEARHDEVEHPLVLQLGGGDAKELARATRLAVMRYPFDEVNLNCGCPSIETGGAAYGASLMRRPLARLQQFS